MTLNIKNMSSDELMREAEHMIEQAIELNEEETEESYMNYAIAVLLLSMVKMMLYQNT
jgi:hypothetical protein